MLSTLLGHSKPSVDPPSDQSETHQRATVEESDDYVNSTPRSEINNPMSDAAILAVTAKHSGAAEKEQPGSNSRPGTSDGKKLSAAGASASLLRRADPKDLPSYPSRGIVNLEESAGRAALLAASQSKSPDLWKPSSLPAAGAAASLANSTHKSPEPWNPGPLPPSAAAAALLADSHNKSPEVWTPGHRPSKSASKAASLAQDSTFRPLTAPPTTTTSGDTSGNALAAAGIANLQTASQPYSHSRPGTATSAVTMSTTTTPAYDINKINTLAAQNAQNRLTSAHPPPSQSQTDKNMSDILRAATISMAKKQKEQQRPQREEHDYQQRAHLQKNYNTTLSQSAPNYITSSSATASSTSPSKMPPPSFFSHLPTSLPSTNIASSTIGTDSVTGKSRNRPSSLAAASLATKNDLASPRHRRQNHHRHHSEKLDSKASFEKQTKYYPHLEEAARKAAADRLARLQAEHDQARKASGLPPTWAPSNPVPPPPTTRPSNSGMHFSKATSRPSSGITGGKTTLRKSVDPTDFARSLKIKSDTAKLSSQLASIDRDKQSKEYLTLLSLAEKNVKSRMQDLETKVAEDQGRVPKHLQAEWDAKAKILSEEYERKRVAEDEKRKGKIDMGGGLWYDQEDLERIARGNVMPILDEINEKATKERARVEKLRLEREEEERKRREELERVAGVKAEERKVKAEEKAAERTRRDNEKAEERQRRAEYKESQRQAKEAARAEKQANKLEKEQKKTLAAKKSEDELPPPLTNHDLEELEPRPISGGDEYDRVDREREMREELKRRERGWFGSIQKKLRRDRKEKDKDKDKEKEKGFVKIKGAKGVGSHDELKEKISEPTPYLVLSDTVMGTGAGDSQQEAYTGRTAGDDDDDVSSLSSTGGVGLAQPFTSTRAPRRSISPISPDGGQGYRGDPGTTGNPIFGSSALMTGGSRYTPRSISSSSNTSTDSDDLYTDRFKSLTSATYHPGGPEEMPAFVPDVDSSDDSSDGGRHRGVPAEGVTYTGSRRQSTGASRISSSSVSLASSNDENTGTGTGGAGEVKKEHTRHHTFGDMFKERLAGFTHSSPTTTTAPPAAEKVDDGELESHLLRHEERKLSEVTPSTAVPAPIAPIATPFGSGVAPITAAVGRESIDTDEFQEARSGFDPPSSPPAAGGVKKSRFSEVW